MHYSVHPSHAFRHRIAKSIGVLVGAALVAVLGLPTAAQAQNITEIEITGEDTTDESLVATWGLRGSSETGFNRWIVTFTEPGTGDDLVLTDTSDDGNATDDAATDVIHIPALGLRATKEAALTLSDARARVFNDGVWEAQVTACYSAPETADGEDEGSSSDPLRYGVCADAKTDSVAGAAKTYLHGVPMMPMNLDASMVPGGVALTWMHPAADDADYGHDGYEYAMDDGKYEDAGDGAQVVSDVDPGEHMFHVRAVGTSDSDRNTETDEIFSAVATITYMMPMPTPTLTQSAALLLGLMLMGGGMYYTRRRQSGGLAHA